MVRQQRGAVKNCEVYFFFFAVFFAAFFFAGIRTSFGLGATVTAAVCTGTIRNGQLSLGPDRVINRGNATTARGVVNSIAHRLRIPRRLSTINCSEDEITGPGLS
jgi:hypothetical protein